MLRHITRSVLFLLVFILLLVGTLSLYIYENDASYAGKIYPNVYIDSTDVGGYTKQELDNYYAPINENLARKTFAIQYDDSIATFSGELLGLRYDTNSIFNQLYLIGRSNNNVSGIYQKFRAFFNLDTFTFSYTPNYDTDAINDFLEELDTAYSIPPENALFEFSDNKVHTFKIEKPGNVLQVERTQKEIDAYLKNMDMQDENMTFVVTAEVVDPEITIDQINNLGIVEKIGEGQSDYSGSAPERVHNLLTAAAKFHGTLIPPGEIFSYNKTIGDISQATGFVAGYVIKDGRTVLGDGGGVCQDSTTLFRAALNTGLPIVERHSHAYRVKYYENDRKPGFDATVYAPTVDLRFKNNTDAYILIHTVVDESNRILKFEFYGKRDGRRVELSDATVYDHLPAPEPLYEETPTLPSGVTKQVDWAAPGAKSYFTYKVYSADGEIMEDETFYSTYRPWRSVFLVGTGS